MSLAASPAICRATTLTGEDFHRLIRAVLPHTATDGVLPVLNAVHLETTSRTLYAAATDRYTMAAARHTGPGPDKPRTCATISRNAAAAMLRMVPRRSGQVTLHIRHGGAKLATTDGVTYHAPAVTAAFPDWRKTLRELLNSPALPGGQPVNVHPACLARFKTAGDSDPADLRTRPHRTAFGRPVLIISAGDWFLGALACIRPAQTAADPLATWGNALTTPGHGQQKAA